jgi:UDP-N-acetylmuramate: L-alanyl-gamma-D-glutamyl-meso-diaminopimelate ligase
VDDFAHHPTAVAGTLAAVRERWSERLAMGRLIAVFEPRSNSSRRKVFEGRYGEAFDAADRVFLSAPPLRHNDDPADFLDPQVVVSTVRSRGVPAEAFPSADALLPILLDALRPGDLALVMSNGSFDGLLDRLLAALRERKTTAAP